ncbi:hypothetical protein ASG65_11490 [Bacillus sp. Leaf13]|nr:hypothetical protein ASG65_11490 [Bacillus sp. Leaf13]KRF64771.1 hypothetical protein ASG99_19420 [Bacillus sp. Soil768D1]
MTYAVIILVIGIIIAIFLSIKKPKKSKYSIWGITIMFVIAPLFSWIVGTLYGISEGSGFAAIGVLIIMFPILFIAGVVLFWIGD